MDLPLPRRQHPAHHPTIERHNQSIIVLVTVCTDRRRHLLANEETVAAIIKSWRKADSWIVGRYVVMPDHLHAFCAPATHEAPPLAAWVKYWKALASRIWPHPAEHPIWQSSFWDRQLRDSRHYGERWSYVQANPVRHGLVAAAEFWPWQGELNKFRFHDTT